MNTSENTTNHIINPRFPQPAALPAEERGERASLGRGREARPSSLAVQVDGQSGVRGGHPHCDSREGRWLPEAECWLSLTLATGRAFLGLSLSPYKTGRPPIPTSPTAAPQEMLLELLAPSRCSVKIPLLVDQPRLQT